jgi:hypothetical protein
MKYLEKILANLILILTSLITVKADLPVHCLSTTIEGDWLVHMGENRFDKDLKCGHKRPDQNLDHYDIDVEKVFKQKYGILVKLERPDKVLSLKDNKQIGKWTMIYDEGFEFSINNQVFFAFSRYKKVGKFNPTNTDTEDTVGYKNICEKTFIGWYNNKETNNNWGCYYAEKVDLKNIKYNISKIDYNNIFSLSKVPLRNSNDDFNKNKIDQINKENKRSIDSLNYLRKNYLKQKNKILEENENPSKIQKKNNKKHDSSDISDTIDNVSTSSELSYVDFVKNLGWASGSNKSDMEIPHLDIYFMNDDNEKADSGFLELNTNLKYFQPDLGYVNKINDPKNRHTWTARVYDEFTGKSYSEMRTLLGNFNFIKTFNNDFPAEKGKESFLEIKVLTKTKEESETDIEIENHEKDVSSNHQSSKYGKLPASFDWRNVDGTNYDSPLRKQGECGSCYAIAAVSVLESRIRIKSNNRLKPILSPSSIISCSRYNQGCSGGYPYLVGKHAKEFGFVDEACQPYSESDDKCFDYCFHQKVWKAKDYG